MTTNTMSAQSLKGPPLLSWLISLLVFLFASFCGLCGNPYDRLRERKIDLESLEKGIALCQ
jgi:hypothetical protein